jgi:hypothetical protein
MLVNILCDANWESKIDHALKVIDREAFSDDYGSGLSSLVVSLMCRDPALSFKQRIRHVKSNSTLYIDVMLDLPYFIQATHAQRRAKIAEEVIAQVQAVLRKRRIPLLDSSKFIERFHVILEAQLNGPTSNRFDAQCLERATGY